VVVGGGLLGLEAAAALRNLGLTTTVLEVAPRLMAVQLDDGAGRVLRRHVEALGVEVRTGVSIGAVEADRVQLADGTEVAADVVVVAAGIKPRDDLARAAGLMVGQRGGVVVDDHLRTSDPFVAAIGEVACHRGRCHGLVAPAQAMAEVLATRLAGGDASFEAPDVATVLKVLGADVAVAGTAVVPDGGDEVVVSDPTSGAHRRLVLDAAGRAVGSTLVGDTAAHLGLVAAVRAREVPADPVGLLTGTAEPAGGRLLCSCKGVTEADASAAIRASGAEDLAAAKACSSAGTGCGSCSPALKALLDAELALAGKEVARGLCAHFPQTRQELGQLLRATGIRSFAELLQRYGTGGGCEICRPTVASLLASIAPRYVLDGEGAALQDTNDHHLANLQRDGTYSVVPRAPGGEITPAQLRAIADVATEFDLYTKVTGGQRIDLFGATVDQLPLIWERLVAAGLESGHAYGKALRTVKSCVGEAWCRYGVQDSTGLAVLLELRYRGLRSPHKIKMAVSGCARECAEAQGKDVGVIATEKGWNLYVGGNGGMRPRHADLLATDLDEAGLVRAVDRFLAYYIRTADRLQRTASWVEGLGIDHVRAVVLDDALGLGAELEADIARHVESYEDEWAATLADPERLARFTSFVNAPPDAVDDGRRYVRIRGQRQPVVAR
jgi:nitrite reductase (NADH) large subunit